MEPVPVQIVGAGPVGMITVIELTYPDRGTEMFIYELSVAPNWASGEFMDLFMAANKATMAGFEVPFSDNG